MLTPDQLANFSVGDIVAVDSDYAGTTGYLGSGAPGTYLSAPRGREQQYRSHSSRHL